MARIPNPKLVALREPTKLLVCKLRLFNICLGNLEAVVVWFLILGGVVNVQDCQITHL